MTRDGATGGRRSRRRGGGGPELTTISWRDIPTQVMARPVDGGAPVRAELPHRFLVAVDAAAAATGLEGTDDYLAQWVRTSRPCGPDLDAEVADEVERLVAAHPREVLQAMVANDARRPDPDGPDPGVTDSDTPTPSDPAGSP